MDDNNDYNEEIENIDEELGGEEEEEVVEEGYDNSFSYGQNVDQNIVDRIQSMRNTIQNFGGPSKNEKEDKKDGKKGLDKKDSLDDNKESSDKKDSSKKDDSGEHTPNINDKSEDELASKVKDSTSKEIAKEAKEEVADKAKEEAAKQVAEKAASEFSLKSIKLIIIKYVAIILGIILAILFVFMFLSYVFENLIGSITTFFGVSEKTTDTSGTEQSYKQDGLLTDYKYQYYNQSTCNLDNYNELRCKCAPGSDNCVALNHEDLIKVLKSDDKCKIDNDFLQLWDGLVLFLNGGVFDDECRLLRYVRGSVNNYETKYKDYNLKLDNGLIVATILHSYDSQFREVANDGSANNNGFVENTEHYEILKNIVNNGIINTKDVDNLVRNSVYEEVYPYYSYENETCVLKKHVDYKFSLNKWSIFMRYGDGENNSSLGVSDSDFSASGYLSIGRRKVLERSINSSSYVSTSQLEELSGSGWVYYKMLNNAWNNSAEECRNEAFFTIREMTGEKDINVFLQKVEDVYSMDENNIKPASVDYMINGNNKSTTVNFDYRGGYVYNKFTSLKKAIDEGKDRYDSIITPKKAEQFIQEIIDRKREINEVLFFDNNDGDLLNDIVSDPGYFESNKYYWPIGSNKTTEINGVTFAIDAPANTKINSYFGKRKDPVYGGTRTHSGVDLDGREGVTNVIAAASGKVNKINNGCKPGNLSCGGGYGNYIKIAHPDGKYTLYAHLHNNSITVAVGDEVSQGQVIAKVGNTGKSTGAHLHFEVRTSSTTRVNPLDYIDKSNPRPAATGTITTTAGNNNKNTVCLSLLKSGISEAATIGLMVNIQAESSFNPECNYLESDGDYSYGLFQWKGEEQKQELIKFAAEKGLAYNEVPAQLNFVFYKMLHGGNRAKQAYDSLMSTSNTAQDKAVDFCLLYERPGNKETHCPRRVERFYEDISKYVKNGCSD